MGKHATQGRSLVGHKSTTLKQGASAAAMARVYNAASLAGPVKTDTVTPFTSDRAWELLALHLTRTVTRINATVGDFRKTGSTFELRLRDAGVLVTVKSVKTKTFTGWQATAKPFGSGDVTVLAVVEKGSSANVNGERADCCGAALNVMANMLAKRKNTGAVIARNAGPGAPPAVKLTTGGTRELAYCSCCCEPVNACFNTL